MLADVVRDHVVIPVGVPFRNDALREISHRHVRVAAHPAIRDDAIVPVIAALDLVVDERISRRDREQVADAGIIVDRKGVAPELAAVDLEVPARAREVVFPRIAREQHAHPTVRVDTEDRDVGVLIEAEKEPHPLTAGINGPLATIGPCLDARAVESRSHADGRRGHEGQAEQR